MVLTCSYQYPGVISMHMMVANESVSFGSNFYRRKENNSRILSSPSAAVSSSTITPRKRTGKEENYI
ncbi:hypothetical protein CIPAW_13G062500 [Carya illinoinensis]|uniref:Uncharacterized protein n=1 Tax=Carya illinoinensis TaxID=32201 RepID=A0A8T1NHB7_CARIL|nr:hypothetical protein CIPAW_13G062500 [Carya illinoinensis]